MLVKILLRLHQKTMGGIIYYIEVRTDRGQMLPKKFTSEDVNVAPQEVIKLIRCQCHALSKRCERRCSCKEAGFRCTSFCGCND